MRILTFLLALTTLAQAELTTEQQQVPLEVDAPDSSFTKIILLAGSVSNKPGQHEYFAGCSLLAECLKQTKGVWPVMVADGWPKNEAVFANAKAIVSYMDAGEKLAWLPAERWDRIRATIKAGAGLVAMHQSVEVPEAQSKEFQGWLGAVWQKDIGSRGHWDMTLIPSRLTRLLKTSPDSLLPKTAGYSTSISCQSTSRPSSPVSSRTRPALPLMQRPTPAALKSSPGLTSHRRGQGQ